MKLHEGDWWPGIDEGLLPQDARYVGLDLTCAGCKDNRLIGRVGLNTFPEDDGEPWMSGWRATSTDNTYRVRCRDGHQKILRLDLLLPELERRRDEVGVDGRRVVRQAI